MAKGQVAAFSRNDFVQVIIIFSGLLQFDWIAKAVALDIPSQKSHLILGVVVK